MESEQKRFDALLRAMAAGEAPQRRAPAREEASGQRSSEEDYHEDCPEDRRGR